MFIIDSSEKLQKFDNSIILVIASWILAFAVDYFFFIYQHPSQSYMVEYWKDYFLSTNIFSSDFWIFLFNSFKNIFEYLLRFGKLSVFALMLYLVGLYSLINQRNYRFLILLISPIIIHLLLSMLKLYPFINRLILYQIPLYYITISIGIFSILRLLLKQKYIEYFSYYILLIFIFFSSFQLYRNFPQEHEEIKKSIVFFNANKNLREPIYIYYGASPAFKFYNEIGLIDLSQNPTYFGLNHRLNFNDYIIEIPKNGKFWIIFSHVFMLEDQKIISQLVISYDIQKSYQAKGSSIYLLTKKLTN
jgi:hypothetical protein